MTVGGDVNRSIGPIGFPYAIHEIGFAMSDANAAGTATRFALSLHLTGDNRNGIITRPVEPRIWPTRIPAQDSAASLLATGTAATALPIRTRVLVLDTGFFLTAFMQNESATGAELAVTILIEELSESGAGLIADFLPVGRQPMNLSTRPPTPRLSTPETPRGAIIRVTQGGMVLAQRTVAWPVLDASIRAKWFNQQVGEPPDPSVEWLR